MMGEWWGVMEGWWWGGCLCMYVPVQVSEWEYEWVSEWVSGWVSEWAHIVPRLHAKEAETQGRQRNPGAYIRPLDSAHCLTPATQKRQRPRGVHPSPWQCTLSHACHTKEAETQGRQRNPGAYIRPLDSAHCRTPATQKRRRAGTPAEPWGVHPTPWQCTLSHACHAKEAETQGRQRNPGAYIRHLDSAHCRTPATQKRRRAGTPAEPWGVHPTPWQCTLSHACHAKEAETQGRQESAGAYIRPLDSAHCRTPATQKGRRPRDASGTPGRTSDPLTVHIVWRRPWCVWVIEWVSECVSEWVSDWVSKVVSEWVSEVSEWVRVSEWVSERGGREAEEEGGLRTKNKNPTRQCVEQPKENYRTG